MRVTSRSTPHASRSNPPPRPYPNRQGLHSGRRADEDKGILPEAHGEQADEGVRPQEQPSAAFEENLVELDEERVEIDGDVQDDAQIEDERDPRAPQQPS